MKQMVILSRRFVEALKLSPEPAYRISWRANVHPNTLSKLKSGYIRPRVNDARVIAIGKQLGLDPDDCFETVIEPEVHEVASA